MNCSHTRRWCHRTSRWGFERNWNPNIFYLFDRWSTWQTIPPWCLPNLFIIRIKMSNRPFSDIFFSLFFLASRYRFPSPCPHHFSYSSSLSRMIWEKQKGLSLKWLHVQKNLIELFLVLEHLQGIRQVAKVSVGSIDNQLHSLGSKNEIFIENNSTCKIVHIPEK